MQLTLNIVGVVIGLAAGGAAGYWIGRRYESRRPALWMAAGFAMATAWVLDLAGYIAARPEVSIGAVALMAGLLTGIKYGGFPEVRVWDASARPPAPAEQNASDAGEGGEQAPTAARERIDTPRGEDAPPTAHT